MAIKNNKMGLQMRYEETYVKELYREFILNLRC